MEIEIPIIYKNTGKKPRHRKVSDYTVLSRAKVTIPEVPRDEFEHILSVSHIASKESEAVYATNDQPYRALDAGFQQHWPSPRFISWSEISGGNVKHLPSELRVPSLLYVYEYLRDLLDVTEITKKNIERDGFSDALTELQENIDRNLICVDGNLYRRAGVPVYYVWLGHDSVQISITRTPQESRFCFSPERLDDALAFAEYCSERLCLPIERKLDEQSFSDIAHNIPLGFNPLALACHRLLDKSDFRITNMAPYGHEAKALAQEFAMTGTSDSAMAFLEAFEAGHDMLDTQNRDRLSQSDHALFDIIREFTNYVPDEYLPSAMRNIGLNLDPLNQPCVRGL